MMQVIRVHAYGGPEAMQLDDIPVPALRENEVLVRVTVAGVNFYDTQLRAGMTKRPLPIALGLDGAGVVESTGNALFPAGTRVAWAQVAGSYATHAVIPVDRLVTLPPDVSDASAAAVLFQGMTAHHLARTTFPLDERHTALVHSAAGGVGLLLVQIAKLRGARVIGVVSSDEKAAIARDAGAGDVLVWGRDDIVAAAKSLTGGRGVDVVYDAVGKDTFEASLASLRPRGMLAVYGEASGDVPPFDLRRLSAAGSIFLTRTSLSAYLATPEEYAERAGDLLRWVGDGSLRVRIHAEYPLHAAADAHRALTGRGTSGKLLLRP